MRFLGCLFCFLLSGFLSAPVFASVWEDIESEYEQLEYTPRYPYVKINPFGNNPLVALIKFSLENPASVTLRLSGKNGTPDLITRFEEKKKDWTIPVYGLYPKFNNPIQIIVEEEGKELSVYPIQIRTQALPVQNLWITSRQRTKDNRFYFASGGTNGSKGIVFDEYDNVRFYFDLGQGQKHQQTHIIHDHLVVDKGNQIIEIYSLLGEKLYSWKLPGSFKSYQHDIGAGPNNTLLVIGSDFKGKGIIRDKELVLANDKILVTDFEGNFIKLFDMSKILNPDRLLFSDPTLTKGYADWLHLNSVEYIPEDNSLLISGKHLGILKIDYDTSELKWLLTPHLELDKSGPDGKGKAIADKALVAVDDENNVYPEEIQKGYLIKDIFHWPMLNHSVQQLDKGTISIFSNNGELNNKKLGSLRASDVLLYRIDENQKTVQVRERIQLPVYAPIASSATYLGDNEMIIFAAGIVDRNTNGVFNKFYRYNFKTGQTLFENEFFWEGYFFQAEPVSFQHFSDVFEQKLVNPK